MLTTIWHQLRLAARALLRERGVTAVALASLALGISANTTVFSLVQAIEFPSLIYPQPSRIVFLESRNDARHLVGMPISASDGADIAASCRTLERVSLTADQTSILREGGGARRVGGRRVTPDFFTVLGVAPSLGRVLTNDDGQNALVLGDGLWRSAFGANPAIVGRAIHLDGGQVTVIGVMPARFDADSDIWVRLMQPPETFRRDDRQFTIFARLAPRMSLAAATREIADVSGRLAAEFPATNRDWTMFPVELGRLHGRDSRGVFLLLQVAVGFVLVIACANIANILLARGTRRRHEMAVRLALGASRGRLVGELLTESVLLALAGGACGVTLAMWGIRLARAIGGFPDVIEPTLNPFVLGFTAALSMLTGILCGIVPALRASAVAPDAVLRADGGRGTSGSRGRLRAALVAVQVASAVVLATCGALMLQSFVNRQRIDLGFDPRGAVRASVVLAGERYRDPRALAAGADGIVERLRQRPDVLAAGVSTFALPTPPGGQRVFTLPAEQDRALDAAVRRGVEAVSPEYFEAFGAALKAGRTFTPADRAGSEPVAIVNEELAKYLWPSGHVVGQLLRLGAPGEQVPVVTVVGVVASIRRSAMHDFVVARAYLPVAQYPNANLTLVARGRGAALLTSRAVQDAVRQTDASLLVEQLRTVADDLAQFVAPIRLITILLAGFGLAGLLLAALGVFGTMSYTVSQRQRELAVRAALGADRGDIVRLVLGSAARITAAGVAIGLAVAFAATRALASFLYGVTPTDPVTFAAVAGFLVIVSLAACQRPARLAANTDPMSVLRQ